MAKDCIIITGATGYLGKAFINELIKNKETKSEIESGGTSLVFTGRSEEKLAALKSGIESEIKGENESRAEIFVKAMDLSSEKMPLPNFSPLLSSRGEESKMLIT